MKQLTFATIYRDSAYRDSAHQDTSSLDVSRLPTDASPHAPSNTTLSNINLISDLTDKPTLLIDNQPIDFLLDIIQGQCDFRVVNERVWVLRYFIDSPYQQIFYVTFANCSASHPDILTYLHQQCQQSISEFVESPRKMVNAVFIETTKYEPTQEVIHYASYLVRDTSSLVFDTLTRHSDRFVHVDGRGTVLLSPNDKHIHTFEMQVILLALAKAYLMATSAIVTQLGECCEDFTPLRLLYKQAVVFNAKSYFACPVKVNRYDAYTLWQDIRKTMPIDDINNEIVQQVQSIHRLLSEEEDAIQHQTEVKISKRLGWIGIGFAALSLVSLFEITPEKVTDFFGSWWHVWF